MALNVREVILRAVLAYHLGKIDQEMFCELANRVVRLAVRKTDLHVSRRNVLEARGLQTVADMARAPDLRTAVRVGWALSALQEVGGGEILHKGEDFVITRTDVEAAIQQASDRLRPLMEAQVDGNVG
jgi:hypothetical protein